MKKIGILLSITLVIVLAVALILPATAEAFRPFPTKSQSHTRLGVVVAPLTPGLAQGLGIEMRPGLVVLKVFPNSPADKAGVKVKDVLIAVNGTPVATINDLRKALEGKEIISLKIIRNGKEEVITVTLTPLEPPPLPKPKWFLEELEGIEPVALFFHFLGGEFKFLDKEGKEHTIQVIPGVVKEITEKSLKINPNGPVEEAVFTITERTRMMKDIKVGDRVIVITIDRTEEARMIIPTPPFRPRIFKTSPGIKGMDFHLWESLPYFAELEICPALKEKSPEGKSLPAVKVKTSISNRK